MKFSCLFVPFVGLTVFCEAAHIEWQSHLQARNPQQLINPDNEPDFTDLITGSVTAKSRILSGVGPQEAVDRWFDWDETCADAGERDKILTAWHNVMSLSDNSVSHLTKLKAALPHPPDNRKNKAYILKQDPAYGQMFGAKDKSIDEVTESFRRIVTGAQSFQGRGGGIPDALRFICDSNNAIMNEDGTAPICEHDELSQAMTFKPFVVAAGNAATDPSSPEAKYRFQTSSSIVFCKPFFSADFPTLDVRVQQKEQTLDKIDCAERILLHEYLHLEWVRDFDPKPDRTGWQYAAESVPRRNFDQIEQLNDRYAWFALYAYFNNQVAGCSKDVWPTKLVKKPVKP